MVLTTSTSVTELVLATATDSLIIAYQYDEVTAIPFARFKDISNEPTATARFPRAVKDAHEDLAAETDALTPVEFETTAVDMAMTRVGIAREISETAFEDNILGRAGIMAELVMDAAILLGIAKDEDLIAEWPNATNEVSDTGVVIDVSDLVAGMGKQRAAKCRGPQFIHLHDVTLLQLQQAQAAATATPWATFFQPNADHTAYGGVFMGAPVFASSLNPTANGAADRVGVIAAQGQASPRFAAFAYGVKRNPTTKTDEKILEDSTVMATITRYGVDTVAANFATKLVFDAG
jgi:hypothetical protein